MEKHGSICYIRWFWGLRYLQYQQIPTEAIHDAFGFTRLGQLLLVRRPAALVGARPAARKPPAPAMSWSINALGAEIRLVELT